MKLSEGGVSSSLASSEGKSSGSAASAFGWERCLGERVRAAAKIVHWRPFGRTGSNSGSGSLVRVKVV